jgi:hypothetical protein
MSTHGRDRPADLAATAPPRPPDTPPAGERWDDRAAAPADRLGTASGSAISTEEYAGRIAEEVGRTWRRMGSIWPGTDFAGLVPLVVDRSATFVIRTDGSLTARPPAEFDQRLQLSGKFLNFGFTRYRGAHAPWLGVPASPPGRSRALGAYRAFPRATFGFALLTHEAFHYYVQTGWRDLGRPVPVFERYPQDIEARQRRVEMWLALRRALLKPERQDRLLAAAAWWYQEWKGRCPDEVARVVDLEVREATAHFVDEAATTRAALGQDAPPATIDRGYRRLVELDLDVAEVYDGTVTSEAHHAGGLACMLLDRLGHPMWQWDAEDGVPPLEALLGPRTGAPRRAGAEAEAILDRTVRARQHRVRRPMEQLLRRLATRGAFFLVFEGLPASDGAFRSTGAYHVDGFPGMVFLPAVSGTFRLGDGGVSLRSAALVSGVGAAPCAVSDAALILPLPDLVGPFGDRLTFRTDQAEVDVAIERVEADHDGRLLLCAATPGSRPRR